MAQCSHGMLRHAAAAARSLLYLCNPHTSYSESLACNHFRLLPEGRSGRGDSSELDCGNALLEALLRALEHRNSVQPLPAGVCTGTPDLLPLPALEDDCCPSQALPAGPLTGTSELSEADLAQRLRELPPGLCSTTPEPTSES